MTGLLSCVLFVVLADVPGDPLPTRLYVRTSPAGARVTSNGEDLGTSDGLFVVEPGEHVVSLELEGYAREVRRLVVAAERITRLDVELQSIHEHPAPTTPKPAAAEAAAAYLQRSDMPTAIRDAMLTVLRQHPAENRWSGRIRSHLFAIIAMPLPSGASQRQAMPALLELAHSLAVHELLKAKSLLERYSTAGLTDATTLRHAVAEAAGKLRVTGRVEGLTHQASVQGGFAVAYIIAEAHSLSAHLLEPLELHKVEIAYRDVMHGQARELMKRSNWKDATLLWHHLHSRELVSQALYLDAARCFKELQQSEDAIRVLKEALEAFDKTSTADFLERAGDIALSVDTPAGQELAKRAYARASRKLVDSVSGSAPAREVDGLPGQD